MMGIANKLDRKCEVSIGLLMIWPSMIMMLGGTLLLGQDVVPALKWMGIGGICFGFLGMIFSLPHAGKIRITNSSFSNSTPKGIKS